MAYFFSLQITAAVQTRTSTVTAIGAGKTTTVTPSTTVVPTTATVSVAGLGEYDLADQRPFDCGRINSRLLGASFTA